MKKRERLELIKALVSKEAIETQQDLLNLLEAEGLTLTQATISRDMNEIGIIKVPTASGRYIYGLPKSQETRSESAPTIPQIGNLLSVSEPVLDSHQLIMVEVEPGNSRLVKRRLKERYTTDLLGIVADDDSLLLIAKTKEIADDIREQLKAQVD